jgi:hypothetical protein
MSEFVKGQCPLCGSGVFVGSCGWLTCSGSECPDPLFVGEIFEKYKESNSNLGELMRIVKQLEAMTVPAPRLSKGELVEIWCKAQYEGRMRELIALYGPESPYVEMYEGGWETCDRASKESNRRSATYIIDALENINAVLSPPVGTQPKEN